ncbi:MAG: hypothetical protein J5938_02395 [Clostridia bacterium]|nr:hypothetical protein [Clostridia bacterium]MBO4798446.1 hypothetical protein [Candidatus Methanomethylophilaceae archaeon]
MEKHDILIFSGQSNMQGQCEKLSETEAVDGAVEYRFLSDSFVPLRNPTGEDITYELKSGERFGCFHGEGVGWHDVHGLGSACMGYTSMVPSFVRSYRAEAGRPVIAVHAAKGGTVISSWLPDAEIYPVLFAKVRGAIAAAKREYGAVGRVAFIWLQGESDALCRTPGEVYLERMKILRAAAIRDFEIDTFAVIRNGPFASIVSWHHADPQEALRADQTIQEAQEQFCREIPDCTMLTRLITELVREERYLNPEAEGHLSALGLETVGSEAGRKLAEYYRGKEAE